MAKHVLGNSDEELDFALIGLTCAEDQYGMVAILDAALHVSFHLSDYVKFALKTSKLFTFSLYTHKDEALGVELNLIPNTSNFEENAGSSAGTDLFGDVAVDESVKLIRELPRTDYFLILKGEDLHRHQFRILEKLKGTAGIIQASAIEPDGLQSKRNLIF